MEVKKNRIAFFINTKNICEKKQVIERCKMYENVADIFYTDETSKSFESLGLKIDARYKDYEYVILVNPYNKEEDEAKHVYAQRQAYYFDNVFGSLDCIEKEIDILEKSYVEGMLIPYDDYYKSVHKGGYPEWDDYYDIVEKIIKKYNINVKVSKQNAPVISEGGCAIIKTKCMEGIEQVCIDEDSTMVYMYVLSLYIQSKGYLPGYFVQQKNLINNVIGYGAACRQKVGDFYPTIGLIAEIYYDTGNGFEVSKVHRIQYISKIGKKETLEFQFEIPANTRYVRFDPCEGNMCLCKNIATNCDQIKINNVNGVRFGDVDLFLTKDPQYILEGDFSRIKRFTLSIEQFSSFWAEKELKKYMDEMFNERGELLQSTEYLKAAYGKLEEKSIKEKEELWSSIEYLKKAYGELEEKDRQMLYEEKKRYEELLENYQNLDIMHQNLEKRNQEEIECKNKILEELELIKNSKSWKMISKIRNFKNKFFRHNG